VRESPLRRLFAHVQPRRRLQLVGLGLLMVVGAVAELASLGAVVPFLTLLSDPAAVLGSAPLQRIFGRSAALNPQQILMAATLIFVAIASLAAGIRMVLLWATNKFVFGLGYDMGVDVYNRTLHQPYGFHVARNTSEIIAGIHMVHQVATAVIAPILQGAVSLVLGTAVLAMLFAIDASVAGAAAISFGATYGIITWAGRRRLVANSTIISRAFSRRVQAVQEGLGGIRDVLLDGSQAVHVERFRRVDLAFREAQIANNFIGGAPRYLVEAFGLSIIAVLAYVSAARPGGLVGALPVLGALAFGAQKLMPLVQQVYQSWSLFAGNRQVTMDVVELLEQPLPREVDQRPDRARIRFEHDLVLDDVGFRYLKDGPWVLQGVDLRITRGARVGFVGRTGSGKSTLLDIVMGLLQPTTGALLVDGKPLNNDNLRAWQAHIAHVPQHVFLSDATLAENIAFGVEPGSIDMVRVRNAARQAQIEDFIEAAPAGYLTPAGERGVQLSGGQRQRIGIARALYRDADILVLDEATSALDDATESAVMRAIHGLGSEMTVLIIAHRLTTLSSCDTVIRLTEGRIDAIQDPLIGRTAAVLPITENA
jgi:ATP-binding cassette, subfamily B, bacterial PglK